MVHGSWLKAHASGLVAQGSWPRKSWRWDAQARALAPKCSWPWAMSFESRALRHEPWTMSNRIIPFKFSNFQDSKISQFKNNHCQVPKNIFWTTNFHCLDLCFRICQHIISNRWFGIFELVEILGYVYSKSRIVGLEVAQNHKHAVD